MNVFAFGGAILGRGRAKCLRNAAAVLIVVCGSFVVARSQSTLQDFPTPIMTNQISGEIAARRIGDSRTTTYFYAFKGETGDTFINVVTENFAGDIDVMVVDGLRLLSRIVVLADTTPSETGRVIYLRKPEKLLLRINGRSPNDDPAKFQVKFAGSFVAIGEAEATPVPELPEVPKAILTETIVAGRSVGRDEKAKPDRTELAIEKQESEAEVAAKNTVETPAVATVPAAGKQTTVPPSVLKDRPPTENRRSRTEARSTRPEQPQSDTDSAKPPSKVEKGADADPMAQFRLVIIFRDGSRIDRPMTEILRFTVDKGTLTVIGRDGRIGRYAMSDVQRVGIE